MSHASSQKSPVISALNGTSARDIEAEMEQLRSDISGLARTIAEFGKDKASEAGSVARNKVDELAAQSSEALSLIQAEMTRIERQMKLNIRKKPVQAVAIAAGVGFLAALLARR